MSIARMNQKEQLCMLLLKVLADRSQNTNNEIKVTHRELHDVEDIIIDISNDPDKQEITIKVKR